jgi:hypothetical protein
MAGTVEAGNRDYENITTGFRCRVSGVSRTKRGVRRRVSGVSAAAGKKAASLFKEKKRCQINAISIFDQLNCRFVLVLVLVLVLEVVEPLSLIEDEDEYDDEHDLNILLGGEIDCLI